jgi:hypothetical protein
VIVIGDTIGTALFLKEFRKSAPQTFVAGTSLTNLETLRELAGLRAVEWTVFSQVVPNPNNSKTALQLEHLNMMKKYRDEPPSAPLPRHWRWQSSAPSMRARQCRN